jgi:hypothetical protein
MTSQPLPKGNAVVWAEMEFGFESELVLGREAGAACLPGRRRETELAG